MQRHAVICCCRPEQVPVVLRKLTDVCSKAESIDLSKIVEQILALYGNGNKAGSLQVQPFLAPYSSYRVLSVPCTIFFFDRQATYAAHIHVLWLPMLFTPLLLLLYNPIYAIAYTHGGCTGI